MAAEAGSPIMQLYHDSSSLFSALVVERSWWGRVVGSLRSRRLEVVGTRKNGRARRRHAPVLSFARYFQAPATQARWWGSGEKMGCVQGACRGYSVLPTRGKGDVFF